MSDIRTVVVAGLSSAQGPLVRQWPDGRATIVVDGREVTGRLVPQVRRPTTQEEEPQCAP